MTSENWKMCKNKPNESNVTRKEMTEIRLVLFYRLEGRIFINFQRVVELYQKSFEGN